MLSIEMRDAELMLFHEYILIFIKVIIVDGNLIYFFGYELIKYLCER